MFTLLTTDILITLLIYLLGISTKKLYDFFNKISPSKAVWKLSPSPRISIVTANTPIETRVDENEFAVTGYVAEYMGADNITSALERIYKNASFQIDMECFFDYRNIIQNLVVIGGPVNNPLAKKIFDKIDIPFELETYSFPLNNLSSSGLPSLTVKLKSTSLSNSFILKPLLYHSKASAINLF